MIRELQATDGEGEQRDQKPKNVSNFPRLGKASEGMAPAASTLSTALLTSEFTLSNLGQTSDLQNCIYGCGGARGSHSALRVLDKHLTTEPCPQPQLNCKGMSSSSL